VITLLIYVKKDCVRFSARVGYIKDRSRISMYSSSQRARSTL